MERQRLYYSKREQEARAAADIALESCARSAHLRMASAYHKLTDLLPAAEAPRHLLKALPADDTMFARSLEKSVTVVPRPLEPR